MAKGWLNKYDTKKMQQGGKFITGTKQPDPDFDHRYDAEIKQREDWLKNFGNIPAPQSFAPAQPQNYTEQGRTQYANQHGMQDWDEVQRQAQTTHEMRDPKNPWNIGADVAAKAMDANMLYDGVAIGAKWLGKKAYSKIAKAAIDLADENMYVNMVPKNGRYVPTKTFTDPNVKMLGNEPQPIFPLNQIEYPKNTPNKWLDGPHDGFGKMEEGKNNSLTSGTHNYPLGNSSLTSEQFSGTHNYPLGNSSLTSEQFSGTHNYPLGNSSLTNKNDFDKFLNIQRKPSQNFPGLQLTDNEEALIKWEQKYRPEGLMDKNWLDEEHFNKIKQYTPEDANSPTVEDEQFIEAIKNQNTGDEWKWKTDPEGERKKLKDYLKSLDDKPKDKPKNPNAGKSNINFLPPSLQKFGGTIRRQNGGTVVAQTGGKHPLFQSDKRAWIDSVLNANKDKEWINRLYDPNQPHIQVEGSKYPSTHLMSNDVDEKGQWYSYPQIQMINGKLTDLGKKAFDYSLDNNTAIPLDSIGADYFSNNGYKTGTGVITGKPIKKKSGGTIAITPEQQYNGLNNTSQKEMMFPGNSQQVFRGLDNFAPVQITDVNGKQQVLYGPQHTDTFQLPVYEKKLSKSGKINTKWLSKYQ